MAIFHLHVDSYRRSRGRTAIGGVAYRRGLEAACRESGKHFNFRGKGEVAFSELISAQNDPTDYRQLSNLLKLYEAIEHQERHPRATVGREVEAALPVELSLPQQVELVRMFIRDLREFFVADKAFFDFSIHNKPGNPHVHICMAERELVAPFEFAKTKRRDWDGEEFIRQCRDIWEANTNIALRQAGISQSVDSRSHTDRGLDVLPSFHEGKAAYFKSEVKAMNETIKQINQEIETTREAEAIERKARKERVAQILNPEQKSDEVPCGVECADPVSAKPYMAILLEQKYKKAFSFCDALSFVNLRDPRRAVLHFKDKSRIVDYGDRVESVNATPAESAQRILALAMAKGWGSVSFSGNEAFLRAAFALAFEHNLNIMPKDAAQQLILDEIKTGRVSTASVMAAGPAPAPAPSIVPKLLTSEMIDEHRKRNGQALNDTTRRKKLGKP